MPMDFMKYVFSIGVLAAFFLFLVLSWVVFQFGIHLFYKKGKYYNYYNTRHFETSYDYNMNHCPHCNGKIKKIDVSTQEDGNVIDDIVIGKCLECGRSYKFTKRCFKDNKQNIFGYRELDYVFNL